MMDKKKQFEKVHIIKLLLPVALFLVLGIGAVAKYVASNAESGVAVASAIYFTANYAGTANEEGTDDALANIVGVPYLLRAGGYSTFYFEVRNHENMLLFNDKDVEIPYEVYFWLAEEPKAGQSYIVSYLDGEPKTTTLTADRNAALHIQGTLKGGAALSDQYGISITAADGEAVPIYVVVKSSYVSLSKVLKGKIQVITQEVEEEEFIRSMGFVDKNENILTDPVPSHVSEMSELFYYINTNSASSVMGRKIRIEWDPEWMDMNRNNAFFMEWMELNPETNWQPGTTSVDGKDYSYIDVTPIGYSSMKFGFFRSENFSGAGDSILLNDLVKIELINQ